MDFLYCVLLLCSSFSCVEMFVFKKLNFTRVFQNSSANPSPPPHPLPAAAGAPSRQNGASTDRPPSGWPGAHARSSRRAAREGSAYGGAGAGAVPHSPGVVRRGAGGLALSRRVGPLPGAQVSVHTRGRGICFIYGSARKMALGGAL